MSNELAPRVSREDIERLQNAMLNLPQLELTTEHYFADGMYCRWLYRPAGCTIVGKVHKREHFYIVVSGEVTISGEGVPERVRGPKLFVSKPGTKRAVYAHEPSVCITVHRTDSRDLDEIERELVEEDPTALFDAHNRVKPLELK